MASDVADPSVLVGTWHFSRVIEDRLLGAVSEVEGELELTRYPPDGLGWEERGTWHRAEGDVHVQRALRLERVGEQWWVRFEDGRDFHPWRPGEQVVHACAPDTYRGRVSGTTSAWTVVWEASGPQKDYRMTTRLTPG